MVHALSSAGWFKYSSYFGHFVKKEYTYWNEFSKLNINFINSVMNGFRLFKGLKRDRSVYVYPSNSSKTYINISFEDKNMY